VPLAVDDSFETTTSTTAIDYDVIANDVAGSAAPITANSLTIVGAPTTIGTASVVADKIRVIPGPAVGHALVKYVVSNTLGMSNVGTLDVNVTAPPGGAAPIANPDGVAPALINVNANPAGTTANKATINVLANDSGNGGTLNPASIQIVANSVSGGTATLETVSATNTTPTGRIIFTPNAVAGTFGFDYTVANTTGIPSLPGHVTVTIVSPESIAIAAGGAACRRQTGSGDWTIRGTSSISTNNTITFYTTSTAPATGTATAAQTIGSAPVVAGAFQFALRGGKTCVSPISMRSTVGTAKNNQTVTIR
jgi:hypothetical protein